MKIIHESTSCLFHLLLLTELFVHSSSRPAHSFSICGMFRSMVHQTDNLLSSSKKLHDLSDDILLSVAAVEHRLESLPKLPHQAATRTLKVNESLSQLYVYTESFRFHIEWLKAAKANVSLPFEAVEGASDHLRHLSNHIQASLEHINQEVPQLTAPSLPAVSNAFDAIKFSVEISERLKVFCYFSKPVLRYLQIQSNCKRHKATV